LLLPENIAIKGRLVFNLLHIRNLNFRMNTSFGNPVQKMSFPSNISERQYYLKIILIAVK